MAIFFLCELVDSVYDCFGCFPVYFLERIFLVWSVFFKEDLSFHIVSFAKTDTIIQKLSAFVRLSANTANIQASTLIEL